MKIVFLQRKGTTLVAAGERQPSLRIQIPDPLLKVCSLEWNVDELSMRPVEELYILVTSLDMQIKGLNVRDPNFLTSCWKDSKQYQIKNK